VNALPQVLSSAAVHSRPIDGSLPVVMGIQAANEVTSTEEAPLAGWRIVTPDYFRALGVPLLQGRTFTERDRHGPIPIGVDPNFPWRVILSERLAELLWPGGDAVGRQAVLWVGEAETPAEIVGIVGDMRERGLDSDPTLTVYLPFKGAEWAGSVDFLVHDSGDPLPLVSTLRGILSDLDPNTALSNVKSIEAIVEDSVADRRFNMAVLMALSSLALVLALIGIYSVQSYTVARRTSEIGIRVALGATGKSVIRLVARQSMAPVLVGIALGLIGALALSRFLSSLLFGVAATDASTYAIVVLLVASTGLLACYLPARRATEVDPVVALREE
jgi:putative ABC transport system permease protein